MHLCLLKVFWPFSIYLESVDILPQLVLLQRSGNVDNLTGQVHRGLYIITCSSNPRNVKLSSVAVLLSLRGLMSPISSLREESCCSEFKLFLDEFYWQAVKNLASQSSEVKKLYLLHYAEKHASK